MAHTVYTHIVVNRVYPRKRVEKKVEDESGKKKKEEENRKMKMKKKRTTEKTHKTNKFVSFK